LETMVWRRRAAWPMRGVSSMRR